MNKYDIFISYRREGGEHLGKMLRDSLVEKGYRVFFDVDSLVSGEFNTALYEVIEGCKDFILICTPNSLDRCNNEGDWVCQEIERAMAHNKNIIPILARSFSFPDVLPPSIDGIRWKNGLEANMEFYDAFIERLQTFMKSKPAVSERIKKPLVITLIAALLLSLGVIAFFIFQSNNAKNVVAPDSQAEVVEIPIDKVMENPIDNAPKEPNDNTIEKPVDSPNEPQIDMQGLQAEVLEYAQTNLSVVDLHYHTFKECLSILDLYLSDEISIGKAKNNVSITKGKLDYSDASITTLSSAIEKKLSDAGIETKDITSYASRCEASCTEYIDLIDAVIAILDNPDYNIISIQNLRDYMEEFGEVEKETACEYYNQSLIAIDQTEADLPWKGDISILTDYTWINDKAVLRDEISRRQIKKQEILDNIAY